MSLVGSQGLRRFADCFAGTHKKTVILPLEPRRRYRLRSSFGSRERLQARLIFTRSAACGVWWPRFMRRRPVMTARRCAAKAREALGQREKHERDWQQPRNVLPAFAEDGVMSTREAIPYGSAVLLPSARQGLGRRRKGRQRPQLTPTLANGRKEEQTQHRRPVFTDLSGALTPATSKSGHKRPDPRLPAATRSTRHG
jgi:hypothetical protein